MKKRKLAWGMLVFSSFIAAVIYSSVKRVEHIDPVLIICGLTFATGVIWGAIRAIQGK